MKTITLTFAGVEATCMDKPTLFSYLTSAALELNRCRMGLLGVLPELTDEELDRTIERDLERIINKAEEEFYQVEDIEYDLGESKTYQMLKLDLYTHCKTILTITINN